MIITIISRKTAICRSPQIHSFLQETEKNIKLFFFTKNKFCLHIILEGVFVTQLSSNAGIPV